MAARSESNDRLEATSHVELVRDKVHGDIVKTNLAWARIKSEDPENLQLYISQSRTAWSKHYQKLLGMFKVPVILFWFSPKPLDKSMEMTSSKEFGLLDQFPQFIDGTAVDGIRPQVQNFVKCLSNRNTGYQLVNRITGAPVTVVSVRLGSGGGVSGVKFSRNFYYPSPEMHEDAAKELEPVARSLSV